MLKLKQILSKGSVKGLLILVTGTAGAQIISVVSIPIVSRLYSPAEFGLFTFALAIANLIAPAATLRFEGAAMLPDSIAKVKALSWLGLMSSIAVSLLVCLVVAVGKIDQRSGEESVPGFAVFVALFVLGASLFNLFSQLSLRRQLYRSVAKCSVVRASATSVAQMGLGIKSSNPIGLMFGHFLGLFFGIFTLWRNTREYWGRPTKRDLVESLRVYWRFPTLFAPSALLNAAGLNAPVIFLTAYFGVFVGGQVGMAEKIVGLPIVLIGTAISQTISAEVSKLIRGGEADLKREYLKYTFMLLPLAIGVAVVLGLFGQLLVPWVLGPEWEVAGFVTQVLAIPFAVRLIANPLAIFRTLLQKSLANSLLDMIRIALMLTSVFLVIRNDFDFERSLVLIYGALTISYMLSWGYGLWAVRSKVKEKHCGNNNVRGSDR